MNKATPCSDYDTALSLAVRGQVQTEYTGTTSLWTCVFVPLGNSRAKQVGVSGGGHMEEGLTYKLVDGIIVVEQEAKNDRLWQ